MGLLLGVMIIVIPFVKALFDAILDQQSGPNLLCLLLIYNTTFQEAISFLYGHQKYLVGY